MSKMNSRDITEILKVFEKRIAKLEGKVVDLEVGYDKVVESKREHINADNENLCNTSLGGISVKTVEYDTSSSQKITYDKETLVKLKDNSISYTNLEQYKLGFKIDARPEKTSESLKAVDGCNEKMVKSRSQKLIRSHSRTVFWGKNKTENSHVEGSLSDNGGDSNNTAHVKLEGRPVYTVKALPEQPPARTEMRYGLVIQFPPDSA